MKAAAVLIQVTSSCRRSSFRSRCTCFFIAESRQMLLEEEEIFSNKNFLCANPVMV